VTSIVRPPVSPAAAAAAAALPLPGIARNPHNPSHHNESHASAPPAVTSSATGVSDAARMLAGHWDALAQALRAMPQLRDFVPRPTAEMAAQLVALFGALKGGKLADWIGREAQRGMPEPLVAQLGEDFARMARLNAADHGAWRFVPVPLLAQGGELGQMLLFTHGKRRRGNPLDGDAGMRLLIEVETAAHGKIQLDGLAHASRFDLILRSRGVLPEETRGAIAAIFGEAREIASLAGDISFVAGRDFVVPPVAAQTHSCGVTA
jgi:hypothetical protein